VVVELVAFVDERGVSLVEAPVFETGSIEVLGGDVYSNGNIKPT